MKISSTRFGIVLVLVVQWVAVALVLLVVTKCGRIFADFGATLPVMTVAALNLAQPLLLVPIAVATTLIVVAAEVLLKSENARLIIQMVNLFLWIAFPCFCIVVILFSLFDLIAKLSH
jgi:hypothetical protein